MTKLTDVNTHVARTGGNRTALTVERGPFSQVPHWVWTLDLEHAAIRVYGILMMHADYGTREGFPGIRRIAEEGHMSTSTVKRSLKALERVGAIVVTRTRKEGTEEHAANHYHLPWEPRRPAGATIATEQGGGGATMTPPGGATIATELETSSYLEKTPTPLPREAGTNPRVVGTNPRAKETNPRAVGTNPRRALSFAVAEARKDPDVRDADKVGRFRYEEDPAKYAAMADRAALAEWAQSCRRCGGSAILSFLADGTEVGNDNPEGSYTERCDHRPRLAVASP